MNGENSGVVARLWRYGPLVFWIGVIFYFSSSFGSFSETSRFIRPLLEFLFPAASPELISLYHGYIRKFAHFAEYAVLGLLALHALKPPSIFRARLRDFLIAAVLVALVAALDEFNQSFNAARSASYADAALDICGGLAALTVILVVARMRRK